MNKFMFDGLFSKEKKREPMKPALCMGMISGGDVFITPPVDLDVKPLNAAVYNRFTSFENAERFWKYEGKMEEMYCEVQGYNLLVVIDSIGSETAAGDIAWGKILELSRNHLIDVVVLQSMHRISRDFEETVGILETLYRYGVKVDCMGYGILEPDILYRYIEKKRSIIENFPKELRADVLESGDSRKDR